MIKSFFWLVVSLLLVAYSQPDHGLFSFLASLLGYALFFYGLTDLSSRRKKFLIGTLWFFGVQLYQLSWMATPYYHGTDIYYPYFGITFSMGLQWGLLSIFFKKELSYYRILAMASFWALSEYARLYFLSGFPFNPIGQSLSFSLISLQWAAAIGVLGLSFWVLLTNLSIYKSLEKRSFKRLSTALVIAGVPYFFGYWNLSIHQRHLDNSEPLKVALVQTGLYAEEKLEFDERPDRYLSPVCQWERIVKSLQGKGSHKIDLILLPESAVPHDLFYSYLTIEEVKEIFSKALDVDDYPFFPKLEYPIAKNELVTNAFVAQAVANYFQSELIMGTVYHNLAKKISHNSAVHFSPNKSLYQMYHKRVLVPLSEYLPVSFIRSFVAQHGIEHFFTPGKEANVFYGKTVIAPSICYEECFSHVVREGKGRGAKLFANLSNDVWFPHSRLAIDHFHLGRFRSVENGVPLIRACNTGITVGVDSVGRVIGRLEEKIDRDHWLQSVLFLNIPTYNYQTIFSRFGNSPTLAFSTFFLSTFFIFRKKRHL